VSGKPDIGVLLTGMCWRRLWKEKITKKPTPS